MWTDPLTVRREGVHSTVVELCDDTVAHLPLGSFEELVKVFVGDIGMGSHFWNDGDRLTLDGMSVAPTLDTEVTILTPVATPAILDEPVFTQISGLTIAHNDDGMSGRLPWILELGLGAFGLLEEAFLT